MVGSSCVLRLGRPKDTAKRAAIVHAAWRFFGKSTEPVTMEAIAAEAGVSKMTIYSHFRDKDALFEAIIGEASDQIVEALTSLQQTANGTLREQFVALGRHFLILILTPEVEGLTHRMVAAARANRELAQQFYDAGCGRIFALLAAIITDAVSRGELSVINFQWAAEELVSLWFRELPVKAKFGLTGIISESDIQERVEHGTDVFMRAYAARQAG